MVATESNKNFTWIHLSDWHEGLPDYDRDVLRQRMLEEIRRRDRYDPRLANINAVVFSGDVAYSGLASEYRAVEDQLIKPLREMLGSDVVFIFAPGNHDVEWGKIPAIPDNWEKVIASKTAGRQKQIGDMLHSDMQAPALLSPFKNFYEFSARNGCTYSNNSLIVSAMFGPPESALGVVAINTAVCCARHSLRPSRDVGTERSWDYGTLCISERQLRNAMKQIDGARIRMLVMHHPINWVDEAEQPILEQLIAQNFDLVLYGHEHLPRFSSVSGNFGDIKFVPAGASFAGRSPDNPRYTNAFNFGVVDLPSGEGAIHHRRWIEERDTWERDNRHWPDGVARFLVHKQTLAANSRYLFEVHRRFKPFHSKRAARLAEISLRHRRREIEGETFIEASVRYKLELYDGPPEEFTFRTTTNKRIENHASEAVRKAAFSIVSMSPPPKRNAEREGSDGSRIIGVTELPGEATGVDYQYRILERNNGVWFFSLGRFVDHVRIKIEEAEGFEYEYLPMGGFPDLQPESDDIWSYESVESDVGHLPGQGYMVQWYLKGT
jgi:hypothetical protein